MAASRLSVTVISASALQRISRCETVTDKRTRTGDEEPQSQLPDPTRTTACRFLPSIFQAKVKSSSTRRRERSRGSARKRRLWLHCQCACCW